LVGKSRNLKAKVNVLLTNNKYKSIRDLYKEMSELKWVYQPRSSVVNDDNDELLAYSHNILNRLKNYFP
jgi:hypothetical protein